MKQTLSVAAKCFFSLVLVNLMCFFVYVSFVTIGLGITKTDIVAYQVYTVDEEGAMEASHVHYVADGEDLKTKEYEAQGIKVHKEEIKQLTPVSSTVIDIITFVCSFGILYAFIYTHTWTRGDKDNNLAIFEHIKRDKLKGLKIGLLAVSPMALIYLLLIANKIYPFFSGMLALFKISNYYMFPIVNAFVGAAKTVSDISWGGIAGLAVSLLFVPAIATLGYYCGNSEISLKEKLIYVKKKERK